MHFSIFINDLDEDVKGLLFKLVDDTTHWVYNRRDSPVGTLVPDHYGFED